MIHMYILLSTTTYKQFALKVTEVLEKAFMFAQY